MTRGCAARRLMTPALLLLVGCGSGLIPAAGPAMPAGSREWIITVDNQSAQDARLSVAEDTAPVGELVGVADPPTVPPRTRMDVTFSVPPGAGWAIFVNPTAQRGPLLLAQDVPPDVVGKLPISFMIDRNGEPAMSLPRSMPGWMGE